MVLQNYSEATYAAREQMMLGRGGGGGCREVLCTLDLENMKYYYS